MPPLSLYTAAMVYVPACSGLPGRLIDALAAVRNCSVPVVVPSGRVKLKSAAPCGVATVLLTVAVIEGVPVVSVGFCELVSVVVVGTLFTSSNSGVAVLSAKMPPLSLYTAAMVYVPACSGLPGRLIDALAAVRNCSVPVVVPSGRVKLKSAAPCGVATVLLTVAVIEGVPVVSVGFCELVSVVVVGTLFTSSNSGVAVLSAKMPPLSLYTAAIVYVPACSGLPGRLIDALAAVRNCSVPVVVPSGRVKLKSAAPCGVATVLLTVAVIEGVPVVSVGFCELVSVVVVGTLFTSSNSGVAVLSAKMPPLSLYTAAIVYVPACSGLPGRLIDALAAVRNCSVPVVVPSGRVTVNTTAPFGVATVLLTVAVIEGVPVVSVGFCELVSVVVVGTLFPFPYTALFRSKLPPLSLYTAAMVYVPACSGLPGRLIDALAAVRNCS